MGPSPPGTSFRIKFPAAGGGGFFSMTRLQVRFPVTSASLLIAKERPLTRPVADKLAAERSHATVAAPLIFKLLPLKLPLTFNPLLKVTCSQFSQVSFADA